MSLERLRITAVRCITAADLRLDPTRNFVFGPNGAGKTTVLECVHLLGRGHSFRTRQTARLVRNGCRELAVHGELVADHLRRGIGVRFGEGHLEVRVEGIATASIVDLARALPVHVIEPQVHDLIEAGPAVRRRYLDSGVFHVEQSYLGAWRDYRRVLAQRNSALRRGAGDPELLAWTAALADVGIAVHAARARYMASLSAEVAAIGNRLLGQVVELAYRPGWRQGQGLIDAIRESQARDRETGFTQVGPHRAEMLVRIGDSGVRDAASRGQQKLVAATLVLGQVRVFAERIGHGGIVLVDDPAAELDADALGRLLAELYALNAQLIVTGLSQAALAPGKEYPVFHVEQGEIKRVL